MSDALLSRFVHPDQVLHQVLDLPAQVKQQPSPQRSLVVLARALALIVLASADNLNEFRLGEASNGQPAADGVRGHTARHNSSRQRPQSRQGRSSPRDRSKRWLVRSSRSPEAVEPRLGRGLGGSHSSGRPLITLTPGSTQWGSIRPSMDHAMQRRWRAHRHRT
jgi:hypothetical protein